MRAIATANARTPGAASARADHPRQSRSSKQTPKRALVLGLLIFGLLLAVAGTLDAEAYRVRLHNGNEFISKYEPKDADFDPNILLIMTEHGNIVALSKDDIAETIADLELRGFGHVIDTTTIEVGWSPNDAPEPGAEGAEGAAPAAAPAPAPFSVQQFVEPNSVGGLPLSFTQVTTPPLQ